MLSHKVLAISSNMELLNRLKRKLPENYNLVIPPTPSLEEALPLVDDVDVIVGVRVPRKMIELARRLKMIQTVGVGADGVDIDAATEKGIVVCSSVGLNAIPVAEHAMSLILALAKNIARYDRGLRSEGWFRMSSTLLKKKTLGIIGLGSIGVEVAKRAKAFDMRIIAIKRRPSEELRLKLGLEFLGSGTDLPHIMAESDFVLVSIVLTPETRRMIGEKELRMMKKSAYLVNISRGGVIDESALVKALKEGTIAGAGLDVFEVEPIRPDNPLLQLENVILTPHVAGAVEDEEMVEERAEFIARNIVKAMNGLRPEKIVDPYLKYVVEREY